MKEKCNKMMKHIFWVLLLLTIFIAGWIAGGDSSFRRGFETGYTAASNYISTRIREGMKETRPFYIGDIGFHFSPRGLTKAGIKPMAWTIFLTSGKMSDFTMTEKIYSAKAEVPE